MKTKLNLPLMLLSASVMTTLLGPLSARQTSPAPQQPAAPTDRKAYTDAMAIKEPDKKIAALEKMIRDFPDSGGINQANQAIFDTLLKNYPDQKARIVAQAGKMIEGASSDATKADLCGYFGNQLLDSGNAGLLDDAEKLINKGLAFTEAELVKTAKQREAAYLGALGRIYLKQGKLNEAERNLKDALEANPQLTAASIGLAELYDKRGDAKMALATFVNVAAAGKLPTPARKELEGLYAKSHNGSTTGLDEMVDARYLELNPRPFKAEPYKPSDKRTERVVLMEVFTGAGCPPCVAVDLALDLAMERYSRHELAVLMYHQHVPVPDPMTNAQTQARARFYNVRGIPTYAIDGHDATGGGGRDAAKPFYDGITKEIEKRLEASPEAQLKLDALLDGTTVRTNVVLTKMSREPHDLKLYIVLAEEKLRYIGENGVRFHPMVVRSIAGTDAGQGLAIKSQDAHTFTWDFDLNAISAEIKKNLEDFEKVLQGYTFTEKKFEINPKNLVVAAFVQNENTKLILQSALIKVVSAKQVP